MTALRVRPAADRDVDDAADYYTRAANLDLAFRFFGAVEQAPWHIAEHPLAGVPVMAFHSRLAELRFRTVVGFQRHLVFYVPTPGCVEVVRVLHGARDLERIFGEEPGEE